MPVLGYFSLYKCLHILYRHLSLDVYNLNINIHTHYFNSAPAPPAENKTPQDKARMICKIYLTSASGSTVEQHTFYRHRYDWNIVWNRMSTLIVDGEVTWLVKTSYLKYAVYDKRQYVRVSCKSEDFL